MKRPLVLALCLLFGLGSLAAQGVTVDAAVSATEVFVGEPFTFQIRVDGTDRVEEPKLDGFDALQVESLGGQSNNSQSITIVNGQMSQVTSRGYVISYRLTARSAGSFFLPPVQVVADSKALRTQPILIRASVPAETEDFKLRMSVSRPTCYVGEAVTLTVTWYLGKDARSLDLVSVPLLLDPSFQVVDAPATGDPGSGIALPVNNEKVTAWKGNGSLAGREYTTITFNKVLMPKKAGAYGPAAATISFEGVAGVRTVRDFFGGAVQQASYRKFVIPSNPVGLTVLEVPQQGRPTDYHGHVGRIALSARAAPTEADVGDPITLTITLSGPDYLEQVGFPPLDSIPGFADRFKIPEEMAAGTVKDGRKTFTQTLRARSDQVKEIPPIRLSYFDTESGTFRQTSTDAIPLVVHAGREVTLRDVEGKEAGTTQAEVLDRQEGIAHNYDDAGVLRNREFGLRGAVSSPLFLSLLLVPVAAYGATLLLVRLRRAATKDPERARARKAHARFRAAVASLHGGKTELGAKPAALLECLRGYLAAKLKTGAGSLTFHDVRPQLEKVLDASVLESLRDVFSECEAGHYAGFVPTEDGVEALLDKAEKAVAAIERSIP